MRLIEHKKGYLYGAANREGESYTDWRAPYIDRSGLLMIYESNSRPGNIPKRRACTITGIWQAAIMKTICRVKKYGLKSIFM